MRQTTNQNLLARKVEDERELPKLGLPRDRGARLRPLANSNSDQSHDTNESNRYKFNQHKSEIDHTGQSIKSNRAVHEYDRICRVDPTTRQLVDGYAQLVIDRVDCGWSCHLMTFPFSQLPGPRGAVIQAMKDELQRVYSTFVTRTNRKPRTASPDELPILIGTADLQVYKRDPASSPLVLCNGGLHFHGLLLVPPTSSARTRHRGALS